VLRLSGWHRVARPTLLCDRPLTVEREVRWAAAPLQPRHPDCPQRLPVWGDSGTPRKPVRGVPTVAGSIYVMFGLPWRGDVEG